MLSCSKWFEKNIVLGANSKIFAKRVHIFEDVNAEDCGFAICNIKQAGEHRNSCSLSSSIVTKKRKDLAWVHSHAGVIDSNFSLWKYFSQTSDFKSVALTS